MGVPALQECFERRAAIDIAGIRCLAEPAHRLGLVAGNTVAGGMHPPQAVRECALPPSPSRRRTGKEFSPSAAVRHTHQRLASGRHGRNALAQIVDV
jgi:hypothetical protein